MGRHLRFGDIYFFILQSRNYSVKWHEVINLWEVCLGKDCFWILVRGYEYFGDNQLFCFRGTSISALWKVFSFLKHTLSTPLEVCCIFVVSFHCLMWYVLSQWCGNKHFFTLHVTTEDSDIHGTYIFSFHPEGEDRTFLRNIGNQLSDYSVHKNSLTIFITSASKNIKRNYILTWKSLYDG
jgi:hypothetical protein